jgi:hypothetical protein
MERGEPAPERIVFEEAAASIAGQVRPEGTRRLTKAGDESNERRIQHATESKRDDRTHAG